MQVAHAMDIIFILSSSCKRRVDYQACNCSGCSTVNSFEIRMSLSDHTAGLDGFLLSREIAEKTLGYDVSSL